VAIFVTSLPVKWNSMLILHANIISRLARCGASLLLVALVSACATVPEDPVDREIYAARNDPAEPTNRYIFDVNLAVMDMALNPIATMYREGVPEPYRHGVRNFLDNLQMPVTILNSALQGDWDNTVEASMSFFINTTAGLGGIFDIPGSFDEAPRKADFGETLAVWGIEEGPYVMLPLIGPSSTRDTVGLGVDILTDPLSYLLSPIWSYARAGAGAVEATSNDQSQVAELRRSSVDFYASVRSLYRQNREAQVRAAMGGDTMSDDVFSLE
jgi:phospholipid-binding lipoprotein MlaA